MCTNKKQEDSTKSEESCCEPRIPLDARVFRNRSMFAALSLCFRAQHSNRTTGVARLQDFALISESSATAASKNLRSVDFRPDSAHDDALFMKLSEI